MTTENRKFYTYSLGWTSPRHHCQLCGFGHLGENALDFEDFEEDAQLYRNDKGRHNAMAMLPSHISEVSRVVD